MDSLPDEIIQYVLSHINNARDVAACNCVSKKWKDSMPYIRSLYFPRNSFDKVSSVGSSDGVVCRMIASIVALEELIVYSPFSGAGIASWLSHSATSLRHLELRMDNLVKNQNITESHSKLESINAANNLETLKLWGVLMIDFPKWNTFHRLRNLEIVGAKLGDEALSAVLRSCPNLTTLLLLGCEGIRSLWIELPNLKQCKLDSYGLGNCILTVTSPKIECLEVQGCNVIRVQETKCLRSLSIANNSGRVYMVDFGNLAALESLSIRGVQWCWHAVNKMLELASEVKHLHMKVEFAGDLDVLQPFPEIDLVDFFKSHPKLERFEIHGAMFAALCHKNSLKHVDIGFTIRHLEELVITIRSPLNAEQKISTLESLVKYSKNLKKMVIRILQMKSSHSSADDFFDEICRFRYMNHNIVSIE